MKLRFLHTFLLGIMLSFSAHSQTLRCDDDELHWEVGINVGLNNDGVEGDLRFMYFPVQYFGMKIGLGIAGEIKQVEDWSWNEDEYGYWDRGRTYASRFKFNPALVLRTPRIINWKSRDAGFYLFGEPGIVLSPGANGSHNAEYFRWDVKAGVNVQIDRVVFTIGYGISNFSLYSGYPDNYWGLPDNDNYITHSGFIGIACKF